MSSESKKTRTATPAVRATPSPRMRIGAQKRNRRVSGKQAFALRRKELGVGGAADGGAGLVAVVDAGVGLYLAPGGQHLAVYEPRQREPVERLVQAASLRPFVGGRIIEARLRN
jgi:hypothetical protein